MDSGPERTNYAGFVMTIKLLLSNFACEQKPVFNNIKSLLSLRLDVFACDVVLFSRRYVLGRQLLT